MHQWSNEGNDHYAATLPTNEDGKDLSGNHFFKVKNLIQFNKIEAK